ncbi:MAG: hypothetical protein CM15mP46_3650 [Alphaproteobacteria bacterium]|nr:MAG: hypothetical protein CM15mP46_3650 [Alphaproteobacteria bacterium]
MFFEPWVFLLVTLKPVYSRVCFTGLRHVFAPGTLHPLVLVALFAIGAGQGRQGINKGMTVTLMRINHGPQKLGLWHGKNPDAGVGGICLSCFLLGFPNWLAAGCGLRFSYGYTSVRRTPRIVIGGPLGFPPMIGGGPLTASCRDQFCFLGDFLGAAAFFGRGIGKNRFSRPKTPCFRGCGGAKRVPK